MKRKREEETQLGKAFVGARAIEMKEMKPRRKGSLIGKVLRLLGRAEGFGELSSDQEQMVHAGISGNNHFKYRRKMETARLEAERRKAEVLMEWQKRRFIC